uniref:Mitochondrial import receptor subunit TOM20 homolog n=1 Tax=Mesocestoides corti TaxID=53468 RepID=A0A5K3FHA9_MESCO
MSITVNYLSISTHKCLNMVNSLVKLTLAGVAVGFLGYCIYFDRKRRSDPEFRFKLAKRRKERALAAERSSMPVLPPLNDRRAVQKFFFDQIQLGEAALSTGSIDEGVQHFAFAIVCSQSPQLLQVLQQSLSPAIFSKLVAALPGVQKMVQEARAPAERVPIEEDLE